MTEKRLRILFITYQGGLAGSTNSISYLSKGLAELGHEVYVGCSTDVLLWELLEGSSVHRIPMTFKGKFDTENWRQIRDAVQKYKIQIINAQSSYDRYTTIFAKLRYGLNVEILHTRRQNPLSSGGFLQRWFYVKFTRSIILISDGLKRIFVEKGYPESHLKVIHNGIPAERLKQWNQEDVDAFRLQLDIQPNEKVVGCVSRFKEQPQIIEAVAKLNDPNIKLVFAGITQEQIQPYVDQFALKNKVICLGKIPGNKILNLYQIFDLNILASTMDGFGLVLVEAMAMDCPVIATNFGGIPDVVKDGENGLLFENGDTEGLAKKITMVLNEPELRQKLIKNGRQAAFHTFSMENTVRNYEQFFFELIV